MDKEIITQTENVENIYLEEELIPIEDSKWNVKIDFDSIDEKYREESIKIYNKYEILLNTVDSIFFVSRCGSKSFVYQIPNNMNDDLQSLSHNEFKNLYEHKIWEKLVDVKKGVPVYHDVKYFLDWKKNEHRRQYSYGIKFFPGQLSEYESKKYYNLWRGFPVEGKQGEFPKIEYHFKHVWCRDNMEHYNYLMAWFADIIQNPSKKKGVALVVKGGRGWGKSIIFENLLNQIFGYTYIKIDKAEQITGKFNQHLQGKLFVVLEEAVWAGDKTAEGTLKSMITDTEFVIEGKGTNAEKSKAYFRLAFNSNEKQAVPASTDERRYFALKVSDEYLGNKEYFIDLVYEIEHGGVEAFMYYLQHLDISNIDLRYVPKTEALYEDISAKMETIERFLVDLLETDVADIFYGKDMVSLQLWGNHVKKSDLFKYFELWEKNILTKSVYIPKHDITTQTKFVQEINKIMSFRDIKIGSVNGYELPSKEVARRMFESKVKSKVVWNDDPSDTIVDEEYERKKSDYLKQMDDIKQKMKVEQEKRDKEVFSDFTK
ncbi:hypothetical protein FACS1894206_09610 [Deltaproteobacteria bacterium]|nr:hypothetical protein FACS1894206_09610 [Deltaproteobacteria bacterium]